MVNDTIKKTRSITAVIVFHIALFFVTNVSSPLISKGSVFVGSMCRRILVVDVDTELSLLLLLLGLMGDVLIVWSDKLGPLPLQAFLAHSAVESVVESVLVV
jgi:hypothetical protein